MEASIGNELKRRLAILSLSPGVPKYPLLPSVIWRGLLPVLEAITETHSVEGLGDLDFKTSTSGELKSDVGLIQERVQNSKGVGSTWFLEC